MVMYFVDSPNWDDFINTKEDINYQIMEIVQKHNCDFAFPSYNSIFAARKLKKLNLIL